MIKNLRCVAFEFLAIASLFAARPTITSAHALWLKTDADHGKPLAVLTFGESPQDETYHLPEALEDTPIWLRTPDGQRTELVAEIVETDDRIGIEAPLPADLAEAGKWYVLEATREYGIYHGFLLTYYAKHVYAKPSDRLAAAGPSSGLKLDIVPRATGDALELTVRWDGQPRAETDVVVTVGDGDSQELKTDAEGKVTLKPEGEGLVAVVANFYDKTQSGELDGEKYGSAAHYATLTFPWDASAKPQAAATSSTELPALPVAVSSFGAAVCDGWLYVYGGHTGEEHAHSAANLSPHFCRLRLNGGQEWEQLPMQTPLQGLPLVAHGGKLYRVGGLNARNATTDDEEDLHSTAEFAEFDPATGRWTSLAPLPAPRSSHNAVVIGDKLYVVGGWTLSGTDEGEWLDDSLVYDFANPSEGWQPLPEQNFRRRALAAGHWQGKLLAIGGMDEQPKVSQRVDVFDPQTGRWSRGPDLPGAGMAGFGVSAWNLDGRLYVSGFRGRVYRLSDDGSRWDEVARLATPRFFHQMVPAGERDTLLILGGASREGHLADIERVAVGGDRAAQTGAPAPKRAAQSGGPTLADES